MYLADHLAPDHMARWTDRPGEFGISLAEDGYNWPCLKARTRRRWAGMNWGKTSELGVEAELINAFGPQSIIYPPHLIGSWSGKAE